MKPKKNSKKRRISLQVKKYDLADMIEYVKKNVKPRPHLNVVKWIEEHGGW